MKNYLRILALVLALVTVAASAMSCADIAEAIGAGSGTNGSLTVETDSAGRRIEKDEQGAITYCEFTTSNPKWRLYWEDDSGLNLSNGEKTFVYDDFRGEENPKMYTHGIMFHPVNGTDTAEAIISEDESEAIILYDYTRLSVDTPATKSAKVVELENGTIINSVFPLYSQILPANGYDVSQLEPYHAQNNGKEEPSYKLTLTAEFKDGKPYFVQGLVTDDKKFDLTAAVGEPFNIGEDFKSLECDVLAKTLMTAFIAKDTETLEEFFGYEKGLLDGYKTLEFGSYKAVVTENAKVLFTVEVTSSGLDTIPVGEHVFELSSGMYSYYMHDLSRDITQTPDGKAEEFVCSWLSSPWFGYMLKTADDVAPGEDMTKFSADVFDFLFGYLDEDGLGGTHSPTKDEYMAAAKAIFGLADMCGYDAIFVTDEVEAPVYNNGHGGMTYFYDFVESGDTYAVVQFYADSNYTIKSHLVRYDFKDGEYLKIVSSEIIEKAEYEPYCFGI